MILILRRLCYGSFLVLLLLAAACPVHAQKLTIAFSPGYQSENFRWSIAGNTQGTGPNIYSELKWKNLAGPVLSAQADWNFWKLFHLRSSFSRQIISSGKVTDMDYQGDNRTNRSYYGAFDANRGMSFSWRTTLEYPLSIGKRVKLTPSIGYALHEQSLYLLSSDQSGVAAGLRSSYATRYQGLVLGGRVTIPFTRIFSVEGGILYDAVNFRGRANWNLIPTFQHPLSFEDKANGFNLEGNVKFYYALRERCSLFLSADLLHGETATGTDWLYLQNGQSVPTQFNGAVRDIFGIGIGVRFTLAEGRHTDK